MFSSLNTKKPSKTKRNLTTKFASALFNSGARTVAMGARIATRAVVKRSGISKEKQKLITGAVDSGTKGVTKGLNYITSTKAQDDAKDVLAKSKAALANPQESLQLASQKAKEYGNQAYAKINDPETQKNVNKTISSLWSSAQKYGNNAKDIVKKQYPEQMITTKPIAPPAAGGGKSRKFYKRRRTQKRSMKIQRHRHRKSRKTK